MTSKKTASQAGKDLRDPKTPKKDRAPIASDLSQYYDQFATGEKRDELRLYGPRWNERTCPVGRPVILSRG